jgi:Gpi18-like mannosyltransferase
MYTYPTAILALFSHSQVVGVVSPTVAMLPREEGLLILPAVLVVAHHLKLIKALTLAAQLGVEASLLLTRKRISMSPKRMMR